MPPRRRPNPAPNAHTPPAEPRPSTDGRRVGGGRWRSAAAAGDWPGLVRRIERKRRLAQRLGEPDEAGETPPDEPPAATGNGGPHGPTARAVLPPCPPPPDEYYARATWASFRLDGLAVDLPEVVDALAHRSDRPALRSRQAQRLRNHAAILHHIETDLRDRQALTPDGALRWYTTVGAGLSTTAPDAATAARLAEVVRRINAPQLRLRGALQEVAQGYVRLLTEPLVPSFNGILARLLLRYHLGRCGLPAVVMDPAVDARPGTPEATARRLVELLEASYDGVLGRR